ncbi:MAG: hypothetical protein ABSE85_20625 [Candidatus Korobacteraceae bacterium]|jgi:hypothetical protein
MNRRKPVVLRGLLATLIFSSALVTAQKPHVLSHRGEEKAAPPPAPALRVTPQLTQEDLEAFLDGFIPIELQRDDIAGAVVAVVKDGKGAFRQRLWLCRGKD